MAHPKFKRVLLKISGEALMGPSGFGVDRQVVADIAQEIKEARDLGVEIAIVVGGGNIFRGSEHPDMDRSGADQIGMLATVINGLTLQDALEGIGVYTRVMSAIEMNKVLEPYIRRRAMRHLEKGRVLIFVAGTGNPYFSTDTAASLRAMEIHADAILKGTKVDGVYSADPLKDKKAQKYQKLTYQKVLADELKVMDSTAIAMCKDNQLPIIVFDLFKKGNIQRVLKGEEIGTLVK